MTKIKLCGLSRLCDIEAANALHPDYIGFVFAPKSRRYVTPAQAETLRQTLDHAIKAVGVFVDAPVSQVAGLLDRGLIDAAQLHGHEDAAYIRALRDLTDKPIFQAFSIRTAADVEAAAASHAGLILLDTDSGGTGQAFDWTLARSLARPYLLAGGLDPETVGAAIDALAPYGVDVSSGIETGGYKDRDKMAAFVEAVRAADRRRAGQCRWPGR